MSRSDRAQIRAVPLNSSSTTPTLFRPEIIEERRTQWLGSVLLEPRVSHWVFATGAGVAAVAVVALLLFGSYTRKERVSGWLVPQLGVARVVAPQPGIVTEIKVREGTSVGAGTPLLVVSAELQSQSAGPVREEAVRHLQARRDSLVDEKGVQDQLFDHQAVALAARIEALGSERDHLAEEIGFQHERVQLSERRLARLRPLRTQGLVAEPQLEAAEQDRLDQAAKLETLERNQAGLLRELVELEGTLRELPFMRSVQHGELDRNVAATEQELAEAEARREIVITAPKDGTVTNLRAVTGSTVQTDVPLLNIVPKESVLQAELFGTSRAIGFVRPGQLVLLRYQAFPYQKFGFYEGIVASVSQSAMSPSDLPQQLSGLSSLYGTNEPVYEITVDLRKQTATAYGEVVPLQAGMQLNADIMIERRSLIEWALDPLFSLTGSWR